MKNNIEMEVLKKVSKHLNLMYCELGGSQLDMVEDAIKTAIYKATEDVKKERNTDIEEIKEYFKRIENDARVAKESFESINDIEKVNYYYGKLEALEHTNEMIADL